MKVQIPAWNIKHNKTSSASSFWIWCCSRACSWAVPSIAPAHTILSQDRDLFLRLGATIMFSSSFNQKAWALHSSLQERTQGKTSGWGSTMTKGQNLPVASWRGWSYTKLQVHFAACIPWCHTRHLATLSALDNTLENLTLPVHSLRRQDTWNGVLQSNALIRQFFFYTVWSVLDVGRAAYIKTYKTNKVRCRHKEQRKKKKNQVYPEHKIHKEKPTAMKNRPGFIKRWNNAEEQGCQSLHYMIQSSKLVIFRSY